MVPSPHSSHGNSSKQHQRQVVVAEDIARQLGTTETGQNIMGVMVRRPPPPHPAPRERP